MATKEAAAMDFGKLDDGKRVRQLKWAMTSQSVTARFWSLLCLSNPSGRARGIGVKLLEC